MPTPVHQRKTTIPFSKQLQAIAKSSYTVAPISCFLEQHHPHPTPRSPKYDAFRANAFGTGKKLKGQGSHAADDTVQKHPVISRQIGRHSPWQARKSIRILAESSTARSREPRHIRLKRGTILSMSVHCGPPTHHKAWDGTDSCSSNTCRRCQKEKQRLPIKHSTINGTSHDAK